MADAPLISVLMPVRNVQRYIAEAVESVLNQTLGDFEFLILDDGSSDDTPAILRRYAARDGRIRILTGPCQGMTAALNSGLSEVRGRYLARMDGDDVSLPDRFEKQVRFLNENPQYVLVGSQCLLIDPAGFPICLKPDVVLEHEQIDAALMRVGWPLVHPAVMMRADAVRRVGGYDTRYRINQDHDLFLRMAETGKLANLPEMLLKYRQHFQSVGARKGPDQANTVIEITRVAHQRRALPFVAPPQGPAKVLTPMDHHANWWWWSLQAGHRATARRHAWAMVRGAPGSVASWKAVYCAWRGR